jgi:hypothetical protein
VKSSVDENDLVEDTTMYRCIVGSLITWPSQGHIWVLQMEWWVDSCKHHKSYIWMQWGTFWRT